MGAPLSTTIETERADQVAEAIRLAFGYDVALSAGPLSYRQSVTAGDRVGMSDLHVGAQVQLDLDPIDELMFVQVHGGTYEYDPWGERRTLGSGSAFLVPPGQAMHFDIDHADVSTCSFSTATFDEIARSVFDLDEVEIAAGAVVPRDAGQAFLWQRTTEAYRDQVLRDPDVYENDLLREEATRFLVTSAIAAFALVEVRERRASGSAAVRRAIAHIEEHLRSPLTVEDIAAAARLSSRGLLAAFQRERGQTPMQYVRSARLAGARRELLAGDPTRGDTVAAIAAAWGFGNPGRFAVRYAEAYGESPRETLVR